MNAKELRNAVAHQCGFNKAKHRQDLRVKLSPERLAQLESICQRHPNKAIQVCNAGDWPDHLPSSFGDWLKANGDSIEINDQGGNFTAHKIEANHDRYNNERPF